MRKRNWWRDIAVGVSVAYSTDRGGDGRGHSMRYGTVEAVERGNICIDGNWIHADDVTVWNPRTPISPFTPAKRAISNARPPAVAAVNWACTRDPRGPYVARVFLPSVKSCDFRGDEQACKIECERLVGLWLKAAKCQEVQP